MPPASAFIPTPTDLAAIAGEATLAGTIVVLLLAPFFSVSRSNLITGAIALAGVIAALAVACIAPDAGRTAFGGMLTIDPAGLFWKRLLLIFVAGVIVIWFASTRRAMRAGEAPEFFTLLLSATIGLMLMGSTSHLLLIVLAIEIASMPSYVLAGFRKSNVRAAEASLKFALFGAVCTAVTIYGVSLVYGGHGRLDLVAIATQLHGAVPATTALGLLLAMVGLLFKISAVPLHFWVPDTFEGAHVDVAAFLSVASKGAGIVLLARAGLLVAEASPLIAGAFASIIGVAAVLTMSVGNFAALRQNSVKRLLAYSSIAHAGYILAAMALIDREGALAAVGLYLAVYMVMNLGAFAVLGDVEAAAGHDDVSAFNGLARRAPLAAAGLAVCLVSMVGLPPAVGVLAKFKVMAVLGQAGGVWWIVLAAVAVNSIVSLAYYARILRAMYLSPAPADAPPLAASAGWLGGACGAALVLLLVFFAPLERATDRFAHRLESSPVDSTRSPDAKP